MWVSCAVDAGMSELAPRRSRTCRTAMGFISGYRKITWCYCKELAVFVVPRLAGWW